MQKNIIYSNNRDYTKKNKLLGELIARYQSGEEDIINRILSLNEDTINGVFKLVNYNYFGNLLDHYEDMRQEGLMAVVDAARNYSLSNKKNGKKSVAQPLTYIFSKCRSNMTKYARQMYGKTSSISKLDTKCMDAIQDPDYIDILETMSLNEGIVNILKCVSSKERKIFEYRYWCDLNNVDTGLMVKLSPHTVAKKIRVARKKIRSKMPNFRSDYIE